MRSAWSLAAPAVVFGLLYVFAVQPQRVAWKTAEVQLERAQAELDRQHRAVRPVPRGAEASAIDRFDSRTAVGDPGGVVADAITTVVNSPAVGGVSNFSVESGAAAPVPAESSVSLFPGTLMQTPVAVDFDARYEQVGRFFSNLRSFPTTFELRSVEVTSGRTPGGGLMHARAELMAFHRPAATPVAPRIPAPQVADRGTATDEKGDSSVPDSVVSTILFSSGRRVALVDGRVVGPGDRTRSGLVRAIEPGAVVIEADGGGVQRVELERPILRMARR